MYAWGIRMYSVGGFRLWINWVKVGHIVGCSSCINFFIWGERKVLEAGVYSCKYIYVVYSNAQLQLHIHMYEKFW